MDTTQDLNTRYAEKFWTLANAIAAFAVLQNLTFGLSLPGSPLHQALRSDKCAALWLFGGIFVSALLYVVGLWICAKREEALLPEDVGYPLRTSLRWALGLRIAAVLVVTIVLAAMTSDVWWPAVMGSEETALAGQVLR